MGFYVTEQADTPSENRVWGFSGVAAARASRERSNRQYPRRKNESTPTTTASGMRYYGFRYYSPELGRWVSRDPVEEEGGVNLFAFVENSPINLIDPLGEQYWGRHEGCCGGQRFDDREQCCEKDTPVYKVPIWICRGRLGGDDSWLPIIGPISHSYVVCQDPATTDDPDRYGKHPRPFGQSGNPIIGPGYINREDNRDPARAICKMKMVCPAKKAEKCSGAGPSPTPYCVVGDNCHEWANDL